MQMKNVLAPPFTTSQLQYPHLYNMMCIRSLAPAALWALLLAHAGMAAVVVRQPAPACSTQPIAHSVPISASKPIATSVSKTASKAVSSSSTAQPSTVSSSTSHFAPSMSDTFVYDLDNQPIDAPTIKTKSGLSVNEHVYIVDMEGSTAEQIANYHAQGKKVICYFSAGTWEPYRSDRKSFNSQCYCGKGVSTDSSGKCTGAGSNDNELEEWGEWWLDIHNPSCLTNIESVMSSRIAAAAAKGCDGVDPDNVDSYSNSQKYGTSAQDQVNYLLWLSKTARSHGLAIDLKNAGGLITGDSGQPTQWANSLVNAFDFNVIESCHQYNECNIYDPFLAAGKPQIQIEYGTNIKSCPTLSAGQKLLVYSENDLDSSKITLSCQ
ncbi:hypothetical protein IAR55_000016 [Kwoniella newhampshirensis]|uniref:alpha-galactosidase n=1 Tax=Kwoniella newhampshirensis TaxID=1651941 RepID=A0AAW0Z5J3_9TREE